MVDSQCLVFPSDLTLHAFQKCPEAIPSTLLSLATMRLYIQDQCPKCLRFSGTARPMYCFLAWMLPFHELCLEASHVIWVLFQPIMKGDLISRDFKCHSCAFGSLTDGEKRGVPTVPIPSIETPCSLEECAICGAPPAVPEAYEEPPPKVPTLHWADHICVGAFCVLNPQYEQTLQDQRLAASCDMSTQC